VILLSKKLRRRKGNSIYLFLHLPFSGEVDIEHTLGDRGKTS